MPSASFARYIGRFAPSPTGPLHLGSLFTALASFLDAKSRQGLWVLRIDDLDTPRNVPGADAVILRTLEAFGLLWDSTVIYQSQQLNLYYDALQHLIKQGLVYPCTCSRASLQAAGQTVYSNYCRTHPPDATKPYALRIKTDVQNIQFEDGLQGSINGNLAASWGDFIVRRKDNIIAYQLAVVVDDVQQHITQVVRGADLLHDTLKQLYVYRCLQLPPPNYTHVPLITGPEGSKLSKREFAPAVDGRNSPQIMFNLLELLQQQPPRELQGASVMQQLDWAIAHWQPYALRQLNTLPVSRVLLSTT